MKQKTLSESNDKISNIHSVLDALLCNLPLSLRRTVRSFFITFIELRKFQKLKPEDRDIVFYAESGSYWVYFEPFINLLIEEHNRKICYVTSSPDDPVLQNKDDRLLSFYIGEKTARTIFFASLDVNILIMTFLDIDQSYIKRSKYPVHYVFLPHNMNSTHMVFRKGAHNHYDTIFCVGPHHFAELREAEEIYGLKARSLVKNGYVRLDHIYCEAKVKKPLQYGTSLNILIAPSWGPQGLLGICGEELIETLLDAKHNVTVRPHRDDRKYITVKLDELQSRFSQNPKFSWEEGKDFHNSFYESHILVTDWSGSAFSFSFAMERPVLFIDVPRKIYNPEYSWFKNEPVEISIRETIGTVLSPEDVRKAAGVAEKLCRNQEAFSKKIKTLRQELVYNFGCSAKKGADYLAELSEGLRDKRSI